MIDNRMFVIQYGGHVRPEKYFCCVVWDSWQLLGEDELYDINMDPGLKNDIGKEYSNVINKMKAFYEDWWRNVEFGINHIVPVIVGSDKENPVIFSSNNWEDGAVNTQWAVAQTSGTSKGGISHIHVSQEGKYRVELRRWPLLLNRELIKNGPEISVGGTKTRTGKALPIEYGYISIDGSDPIIAGRNSLGTSITIEMKLHSGNNTFRQGLLTKMVSIFAESIM